MTGPPAWAADLQDLVWLHETPQVLSMAPADTPASNAATTCLRSPSGSVAPPMHATKGREAQRAARDAWHRLRWTDSVVSIGAWLEAPRVVTDLGSINTLCCGAGAAPVNELVTRKLHKARSGAVSPLSGAPYGYLYIRRTDNEPARYQVLLHEAKVVRSIYSWLVEEQVSIGEITRRLRAQGVPTRTGKGHWDRSWCGRSCATLRTRGRRLMARRNRSNADSFCGRFANKNVVPGGPKHMPRQAPRGMGLDSRAAHRGRRHLRGRTRAASPTSTRAANQSSDVAGLAGLG